MKNSLKKLATAYLLVMAIVFSSCQSEFEELPNSEDQTSIRANSTTANLIKQASSKDGSFDNIIDGASCIAIQFPYTVKVNGLEITIDSIEDLTIIESILEEIDGTRELLDIIFPITVSLPDFTEVTITGLEDLENLVADCLEGGDDEDIECIDFVYPLNFFTFDINNQRTGTVQIESDKQLRRFLDNLDDDDLVSLDFPVSLELFDGTKITVNSNIELADALSRAKNACDEDDDNDYNDDDFSKERLDNYLVECPFIVYKAKRQGEDQSERYREYAMDFSQDGMVKVYDRQGNIFEGTWSTRVGAEKVVLNLNFESLVDFTLEWAVYEIGEGKIKFYANNDNNINLKRNCDFETDIPNRLRQILKQCNWEIAKVIVAGDSIERLIGYKFEFKAENVVTLSGGSEVSEGRWEIKRNNNGVLVMSITMGTEPGLNFEWPLVDLTNERLKFEIPETDYELILKRNCNEDRVCSEAYINEILQNCKWKITNEDGTFFQDLRIDFSDRNIHVRNLNGTVVDEGNWELTGARLRFNNLSMALANYIGDWDVIECGNGFFRIKRADEIIKLTKECD